MARTILKTTRACVNPAAAPERPADVSVYARDLHTWPRSWMGYEKDVPPGEALVVCFRPFIAHLAASNLSPNTIRKHVDNLWSLGGEIIRDLNNDPPLRKVPADRLLRKVIHPDGGPLLYHGSEEDQHSFDATCRKLHRFLSRFQR